MESGHQERLDKTTMLALLLTAAACTSTSRPSSVSEAATSAYRALGTEPFWNLTMTDAMMRFTEAAAAAPVEEKTIGAATVVDDVRRYRSASMAVEIAATVCSDGMTDRLFPDTVTVTIAGRTLHGCGGDPLPPADLVATDWQIEAVNGRVVLADGAYILSFTGTRFTARLGCSTLTGEYRREGRRFLPERIVVTDAGTCPDPEHAREAAALLSRPAALVGLAGERMSIANEAGAITLQRRH